MIAIAPDVLERLADIRETQRKFGGCSRDDALDAVRDALDRAQRPDDEDHRRWLTFAAAWALYALELHDASAGAGGSDVSAERLTVDELIEAFYRVAARWNGCELPEEERRAWFEERRALAHLSAEEIDAWCATPREDLEASMWEALEEWNEEEHRRRACPAPAITIEPWRAPVRISRADAIAAGLPDPLHADRFPVKLWPYIPVGPWR